MLFYLLSWQLLLMIVDGTFPVNFDILTSTFHQQLLVTRSA